ncbi:MAG: hypothetical protein Q8P67_17990 [archaeon]|nr:hypothetical protein [archaeon]
MTTLKRGRDDDPRTPTVSSIPTDPVFTDHHIRNDHISIKVMLGQGQVFPETPRFWSTPGGNYFEACEGQHLCLTLGLVGSQPCYIELHAGGGPTGANAYLFQKGETVQLWFFRTDIKTITPIVIGRPLLDIPSPAGTVSEFAEMCAIQVHCWLVVPTEPIESCVLTCRPQPSADPKLTKYATQDQGFQLQGTSGQSIHTPPPATLIATWCRTHVDPVITCLQAKSRHQLENLGLL